MDAVNWQVLFAPVVIALIPILVNFIKKLIPAQFTWAIPLLAMVLGPVADFVSQQATGTGVGPVAAAALGLAAVGLREIVNQLRQAFSPTP
ncbi:MAG TPA: hypothetical protein VLK35_01910 [Methylomirabilota bacterium]|nr:hypothetical protein [Methylomirabilota bacterium]